MIGKSLLWLTLAAFLVSLTGTAARAQSQSPSTTDPAVFSADEVLYDDQLEIVTARGNVEIVQGGRTLLADLISYDRKQDIVTAFGNISLLEPSGDVMFAEKVELSGDLKTGVVTEIRILMEDNSRFAARGGRRTDGNLTELKRAVYSPCELCKNDPEAAPLWQIRAAEVNHDQKEQTIEYYDAVMEFYGIPFLYLPYFQHPDPTVKRRSGFLAPTFGNNSDLGFFTQTPYFWNISEHEDATFTPIITSQEGAAGLAEYRWRGMKGRFDIETSITEDSNDDVRGHVFSESRFDIDDTWRWGLDVERSTDDTYLDRYQLSGEDDLTSRAYVEGFSGRRYASASAYAYQGLREDDDPGEAPLVLPFAQYDFVGEPTEGSGRYFTFNANTQVLQRSDGTDSRRMSLKGGWNMPYTGPMGDEVVVSATVQSDLYHVNDVNVGNGRTENGFTGRVFPQASVNWSWPLVRDQQGAHQIIKPMASAVVAPYGGNPSDVPNEDSQNFEFDDTNLFSANRFTGYDRVEGGPRLNYGMNWGWYGNGGGRTEVPVGQSFRGKGDDTFKEESGLQQHFSDLVGRVEVAPTNALSFLYRFRLSKENLEPQRQEIGFSGGERALSLGLNYIQVERQGASDEFDAREEISLNAQSQLSKHWIARADGRRDLTSDGGWLRIGLGLSYEDECFGFSADYVRSFTRDRDVNADDTFMLRFLFKNLGEVGSPVG